jgi:ABC-type spermidine/putrescine transport system permease subunit II
MNQSIYGTNRTTLLKTVVVALVAGIGMMSVVISTRLNGFDDDYARAARVLKLGKWVAMGSNSPSIVPLMISIIHAALC